MQKQVSKKSLAIVALSILLAVCMALTATYAALYDDADVNGSITFNDSVVLTFGAGVTSNAFSKSNVDFNASGASSFIDDDVSFGLNATSDPAYLKVEITVTNKLNATLEAPTGWTEKSTGVFVYTGASGTDPVLATSALGLVKLNTFFSALTANQANISAVENADCITFTVTADALDGTNFSTTF